jgi:nitric oxide reductase NorD protein
MTPEERLIGRLAGALDGATATALIGELVRLGTTQAVLELLDELQEASPKAAQGAIAGLPELHRRCGLAETVPWLDLGVALAGSSGAAALKYFKESPLFLGSVESVPSRRQVMALAMDLAENDPQRPNIALDFLRKVPELLAVLPGTELGGWAQVGADLARWDYVLGIEFLRESPVVARVVPLEDVRAWVGFGMKLVTRNSLGRTDYLATLEFFRTSPAILGEIPPLTVRRRVVDLGSVIADRDPQLAIAFLADAPSLLRRISSEEWQTRVLQYGVLIAERDAESALAFVRRCPEILELIGIPTPPGPSGEPVALNVQRAKEGEGGRGGDKFDDWFKTGMDVLGYSADGARAYFSLETRKALASVEEAMSGVPLRQLARSLKLYAQGLCGAEVMIRSLPERSDDSGAEPARATVSPDGRTIALPPILRRYPTREENIRLYTVMTAHEAGHLEFGTYSLPLGRLADLIDAVSRRYGRGDVPPIGTLDGLFARFPQPALIRDLWSILEDARVEYRLQREYPGLQRDLAALARDAVRTRSLLHGMSVREMVVDCLLLLSTAEPGTVGIPNSIAGVVGRVWALCQTILTPSATAEDAVRLADRIYVTLDEMLAATPREAEAQGEAGPEVDQGGGPKASEEITGQYRPVTNWAYRGTMNPEVITDRGGSREGSERGQADTNGSVEPAGSGSGFGKLGEAQTEESLVPAATPASTVEQTLVAGADRLERREASRSADRAFLYDEWDGLIQDYRSAWCRVIERMAPEGTGDFVEATLAAHGPAVRLLRRYFESIRPQSLRRLSGQTDGEDLDLDAAIRLAADRQAGAEPSDRIYVRREKRERAVAVAFLVDLSGSTSRQIESPTGFDVRRVIDVEKEGLLLLCEALEAIGDQYAVYGYSGQGRNQVDFLVLKEFDEPTARRAAHRIGAVAPLQQNRDGAAIRHAVHKLLSRSARVRLLILISDGKPLDDGYADEYSLEDTKMALREARLRGIDPFCITVDRGADDYLRRMYGDVRFLIIDRAEALPERLPRVYQRLTT